MNSSRRNIPISPKHAWSDKDRLILSLMKLCFQNHPCDFTKILNHLNRQILRQEGFSTGLPPRSITAQLHEFENGRTGSHIYNTIRQFSVEQLFDLFDTHIQTIQSVARRLHLNLRPTTDSNQRTARTPTRRLFQRLRREETVMSETSATTWVPDTDESTQEEVYTPTRRSSNANSRSNMQLQAQLPEFLSPRISADKNDPTSHKRPYFIYRAFEYTHGLTARKYLDGNNTIPAPPPFRSQTFSNAVQPHLRRDKRYASPFLSFAENPAVSIKHTFAKVSEARGIFVGLAIFKYDDIKEDAMRRYGIDSGPYLVSVVCKEHDLCDLPGGYTGTGEFLVWGSVEAKPIAIIDTWTTLMIRGIVKTTYELDEFHARRLQRYLPPIPNHQHLELFIYQLIKGFKVGGHQKARKSAAYNEYVRIATTPREPQSEPAVQETQNSIEDDEATIAANSDPVSPPVQRSFAVFEWRSDSEE